MTNDERNPKPEARRAFWRAIAEFVLRCSEFLRISSFVIRIWKWRPTATAWRVVHSRQLARIPDGPLVLCLLAAILFCRSLPVGAGEVKSDVITAKPIPIAKLKHPKPVDFDREIL